MSQDDQNEPTHPEHLRMQGIPDDRVIQDVPVGTEMTACALMPLEGAGKETVGNASMDTDAPEEAEDGKPEAPAAADEEGSTFPPETESPEGGTSASNASPPAETPADMSVRYEPEKQPYDFDHCTIQIVMQLLPDDGDPNGRRVVVGVRSHLDAPILRLVRLDELGAFSPFISTLLDELKHELPRREEAARAAIERAKAEKAKRQAGMASKSITAPRGKMASVTTRVALPAANPTDRVVDTRPSQVAVPTHPQRQLGLF